MGIPCTGLGPGNELYAHSSQDCVAIEDLVADVKIYPTATTEISLQTQDKEDEERLTDLVLGWDSTNYAYLKTCSHVTI